MDAMLSTSEVAELTGISLRHVKRLAASNKLPCEKTVNSNNRPKYLFPLSGLAALDPTLPQRYLAQHAQEGTAEGAAEPQNAKRGRGRPRKGGAGKTAASKPLEEYSTEERGEIAFWTQAVQDWRGYRAGYRDKAAADEAWLAQFRLDHPEVHVTRKILYARQRAVLEDDLDGLVDGRGKARRGYCKIPAAAWDAFMYYYLDQRQSPIKQCYDQTIYFLEQHCPEALPVPDYTTFYRHVMADVPEPVKVMGREGPKAFYDRCSHYIRREYENMQSNEYWIADTHTFDVVTKGDGGGTHRLYLTAFMDARSGIFVGCHVADTNSSQNVLTALRRGILRYGIPDNIYVDNGREYLNKDVGGTGHRTRKTKNEWQGWDDTEKFVPPPVFTRLGIKMTNAIVRNARAKTIERRFCDVKNQISRLFDTFCGGTVVEKPEQLKHLLKGGEVVLDSDFTASVQTLLDGLMNESEYNGPVQRDHGKTKLQVWRDNLSRKRIAAPADLNLMLMRSSRPLKVGRNGITANLYGAKLDYYTDEFTMQYQGKKVYYRYDPDDLRTIRAYDPQDRFICELPCRDDMVLEYGANRESIQAAMHELRGYTKLVKNAAEAQAGKITEVYGEAKAFDVCLAKAQQNIEARITAPENAKPPVVELQFANEGEPLLQAVGAEHLVDFGRMTANAIKQHEQKGSFEDENL